MMRMYFTLPCYPWNRYFKANGYPHIAPGWPETAKKIFFGAMGPTSNTVGLSDGRLISMAYCRGKRADVTAADYWFAYALESADRGKSWRHVGGVPWEPKFAGEEALFGGTGFTEAGLALLDSGELLIVLRSGSHQPMATCRSSDAGRTWSSPEVVKLEPTGEPARGVFPVLKRLSNGWLACVYGRPGIQLMVDETGTGRHWRHEIDLKAEEARRCERGGAPADFYSTENVGLAELAPGEIGITYDLAGWTESRDKEWVRQTIRMARLRVRGS
jgi:hypothetical protein